ncbi:hypothetical protein [Arcobacter arenosus]|uniref:hypothetical protein n=1 Tax=Arcobacter arenosus TaxID=2576037 RepID=UPI003BABF895
MNEIEIHDIKKLVGIPDFSLYIYFTLWILGVILFFIFIFLLYKYFKYRKKDKRKHYYKTLKELDLNNSKNSAYVITKYARLLAISPRDKKLSDELIEELESFKYKKEVAPLSDEVKILFGRFMDNVDV